MSGATTWCVVYNGSGYPQTIDEEGHSVDPSTFACARRSIVHDLINQGSLIAVDRSSIGPDSSAAARLAADEADRRNAAIDAEKNQGKDEEKPARVDPKPDKGNDKSAPAKGK